MPRYMVVYSNIEMTAGEVIDFVRELEFPPGIIWHGLALGEKDQKVFDEMDAPNPDMLAEFLKSLGYEFDAIYEVVRLTPEMLGKA